MKAEIGFVERRDDGKVTDRLRLVVQATTSTEATTLKALAMRLGWIYDQCSGTVTVEEPDHHSPG